jgi:hypothetical protein
MTPGQATLAAAAFGFATFALSVGLSLVVPTRIGWLLYGGDPEAHFLGWHLFRNGPWASPVGATPLLTWPVGSSVGLTDSIPLLALAFKAITAVLPADFQYQGLWLLSCFVLQGVFAARLMRVVTTRPELQLLGACLFVMSPPLLNRYYHEALAAHWLILWALGLSFAERLPYAAWLTVSWLAAATHPYLALMIGTLMLAAHARAMIADPSASRGIAGRLLMVSAGVALLLWQCGYFVVGWASLRSERLGYYSMNLLSPLLPASAYESPSGPLRPATDGQIEGLAYLGVGVMLLSVGLLGLARRPKPWVIARSLLQRHLPLSLAMCALVVLALSPTVTLGPWTLVSYDPSWWGPLTLFRASGRLVWPAFYLFVLATILAAVRSGSTRAVVVLCAAVLVQAWDVSDAYRVLRRMRTADFTSPLHSQFWSVVPRHYQRILLFPTRMCTAEATFDFRPFALVAGRFGMAIDAGATARPDTARVEEYCRTLDRDMSLGHVDPEALYVVRRDLAGSFEAQAGESAACMTVDAHDVCAARETLVKWQDEFDPMYTVLPALDELVAFHAVLEDEYRVRLNRPAYAVGAPAGERVALLARYLWYRRGGCQHDEAARKILDAAPGLRVCGDPFRGGTLPALDDTFAWRRQLDAAYRGRPDFDQHRSHVDLEGEAVWVLQYVAERLSLRDVATAREAVLERVRSAAR